MESHARTERGQQPETTNHIALPSRQVSPLISNGVFNINAPANGTIRLNSRYLIKRRGRFSKRHQHQHDARRRQDIQSIF